MKIFLGNLANSLKFAKDKNKEYSKEIKKLQLSLDHAESMQIQLLKIKNFNNKNYLIDIETVLNALSCTELAYEVELFVRNWYDMKNYFHTVVENYNNSIEPIQKNGHDLFLAYFNYTLEDLLSYTEIISYDPKSIEESSGIISLLESVQDKVLLDYTVTRGTIITNEDVFNDILGKYILVRYKDLTGNDLYESAEAEKISDLLTLTTLLITFLSFIEEEKENISKYIEDYTDSYNKWNIEIDNYMKKQVNALLVIGSIIKIDLYYSGSELQAKRIIYKANKYYERIKSVLQEIIDRHNLNITLRSSEYQDGSITYDRDDNAEKMDETNNFEDNTQLNTGDENDDEQI